MHALYFYRDAIIISIGLFFQTSFTDLNLDELMACDMDET
jgi:hypothetical protein